MLRGMTNEEALEIITNALQTDKITVEQDMALALTQNALKKRIPKKVVSIQRTAHNFETGECPYSHYKCEHIKPYNYEYEYTDYKCPVCNKRLSDGTPYYCCHCGQALDWVI